MPQVRTHKREWLASGPHQSTGSKEARFEYEMVRVAIADDVPAIRIRTTCVYCGESSVGSKYDGSLETWEDAHECATA